MLQVNLSMSLVKFRPSGACDSNAGCQCSASYTGVYCNERIFAFKFGSSLELKMTKNFNSFSMQFRSSSSVSFKRILNSFPTFTERPSSIFELSE